MGKGKIAMMRIMDMIMLPCDRAGVLMSKRQHVKLSFFQSMQLRMHLAACKLCKLYNIEIEFLHKELKHQNDCAIDGCLPHRLDENQKEKISQVLEKQEVT